MNARLRLQQLPNQAEQTLVIGDLVGVRGGDRIFSPAEVAAQFRQLRVPPPGNVSQVLSRLEARGLVMPQQPGRWSLTPLGDELVASVAISWSSADFSAAPSAGFGGVEHHSIEPEFAPVPLIAPIEKFLAEHPFDHNAFGISRYPSDSDSDPIPATFSTARIVLERHGLEFHLASDRAVADDLWSNVAASMWACRYGVAVIEDRVGRGLNQNALIEVGAMLMTGRRCVLLRDVTVEEWPSDLIGHIYRPVNLDDQGSVADALDKWCEADLGLNVAA